MEKEEIYEMVIREMTELAIHKRDVENPDENKLKKHIQELSIQVQKNLNGLPENVKKIVIDYMESSALAADHDCQYLYVQGAKDCIELLKRLGILQRT
ncbi:MAG: hypothetical protein HFH80_03955 [Lachnospiraceae bacterium]|nr:hypothetical protein [Lachnospiraceae bacterium]